MYPFSVTSKFLNAASLFKLKDGRFQIINQGDLFPFLQGHDYILVEPALADFLNSLNIAEIEFKDAVIWDRETNEENKNFKELIVSNRLFYSENFENIELKGRQMYFYDRQYLFISYKLKEILETSTFDHLSFSEGWSNFAY